VYSHISGVCAIPIEISILSYLQSRLQQDAMDGPLTDYESFDSDPGSDCGLSDGEACPSGGEAPPRKRKRREHSRSNHREKWQRIRETEGGGLKGVSRKRQLEGTRDAIQVPYCLGDEACVSSLGWIGRHAVVSPLEGRSLQELLASEDLAYFPWDGRYVLPWEPTLVAVKLLHSARPTCLLTRRGM
jgi:hypothetical protein